MKKGFSLRAICDVAIKATVMYFKASVALVFMLRCKAQKGLCYSLTSPST